MASKLKVYTAPIGFHDVYVAAASKAAALRAWGSEHDLFARGIASVVTDAALTEAPLAEPGKVIRRSRGTAAEQLAALPPDEAAARAPKQAKAAPKRAKARPRPDRAPLDDAERALAEAAARHADATQVLETRLATLERELKTLRSAHDAERDTLERARAAAEERYDAALAAWHRD